MATAQAQRTTTATVTESQSLSLMKNMLRTTICQICYLRGVFDESCFKDKKYAEIKMKKLFPVTELPDGSRAVTDENAFMLTQWLEKGVFDALERKYLRRLVMSVYSGGDTFDSSRRIEAYEYIITYPGGQPAFKIQHGSNVINFSASKIRKEAVALVRTLIAMCHTMAPIDGKRWISLDMEYYEEVTPAEWNPTYFADIDPELGRGPEFEDDDPLQMTIGRLRSPHHSLNFRIKARDTEDTDGAMAPSAAATAGSLPPASPLPSAPSVPTGAAGCGAVAALPASEPSVPVANLSLAGLAPSRHTMDEAPPTPFAPESTAPAATTTPAPTAPATTPAAKTTAAAAVAAAATTTPAPAATVPVGGPVPNFGSAFEREWYVRVRTHVVTTQDPRQKSVFDLYGEDLNPQLVRTFFKHLNTEGILRRAGGRYVYNGPTDMPPLESQFKTPAPKTPAPPSPKVYPPPSTRLTAVATPKVHPETEAQRLYYQAIVTLSQTRPSQTHITPRGLADILAVEEDLAKAVLIRLEASEVVGKRKPRKGYPIFRNRTTRNLVNEAKRIIQQDFSSGSSDDDDGSPDSAVKAFITPPASPVEPRASRKRRSERATTPAAAAAPPVAYPYATKRQYGRPLRRARL